MAKKETRTPEEFVATQHQKYKGDWLSYEVATRYRKKAEALGGVNSELTGERFNLYIELQEKYGVTQIEADKEKKVKNMEEEE